METVDPVTRAAPALVPSYEPAVPLDRLPERAADGELLLCCDNPRFDSDDVLAVPLELHGWAYSRSGITGVWAVVDGVDWIQAVHGLWRPDLIDPLARADAAHSAFSITLGTEDLAPGRHTLEIVALDGAGAARGTSGEFTTVASRELDGEPSRPVVMPERPVEQIDGGGERFVPELHEGAMIEAEHQTRYRWAAAAAAGRDVLDAGCGVGWGTLVLAEAGATSVTGVDIHPGALENARERAGGAAEFVQGDLVALPFDDDAFDLVTCFEAIEHVPDPARVLDELRRVLRPEGVLLVSSPNRGVYPAGNPHHLHELTAEELEAELRSRFSNVAIQRQQTYLGSLLLGDDGFASTDAGTPLPADVRKIVPGGPGQELYTIGIAGDGALPELGGVAVLTAPVDVKAFIETVATLKHRAILAETNASTHMAAQGMLAFEQERALSRLQESDRRLRAAEERIAAMEQEQAEARQQLHEAQQGQRLAEQWLDDHRRSLSWRVTVPLRAAKRRLAEGRHS